MGDVKNWKWTTSGIAKRQVADETDYRLQNLWQADHDRKAIYDQALDLADAILLLRLDMAKQDGIIQRQAAQIARLERQLEKNRVATAEIDVHHERSAEIVADIHRTVDRIDALLDGDRDE